MRTENDIALIDRILKEQVYRTWPEALAALCMWCEEYEISLRFNYHSGWFARPKGDDPTEMGEPFLEEDERGYTIEVGMVGYANDDGSEAIYEKPAWAVHDGLRLLKSRLQERLNE